MPCPSVHLSFEERRRLTRLREAKVRVDEVVRQLGRHRSTIHREIKGNRRFKLLRHPKLQAAVVERLQDGRSPEQKLPEQRRTRRSRRGRRPGSLVVPAPSHIRNRPEAVNTRSGFGPWEADLMIFRKELGPAEAATVVEGKSRQVVLFRNDDRRSRPLTSRPVEAISPPPQHARRSLIFDRALELVSRRDLEDGIGARAWFCDPQVALAQGLGGGHEPRGAACAPKRCSSRSPSA